MKEQLAEAFVAVMVPSPTVFIVGALIVLLVPVLVHFWLVQRTDYIVLPSILLAGPSGAGKTALMVLLERGGGTYRQLQTSIEVPQTATSIIDHSVELSFSNTGENTSNDDINDKHDLHHRDTTHTRFLLHDTPGFPNRRYLATDYILASTNSKTSPSAKLKAVVFVVDSAAMGDDTINTSGSVSVTTKTAEYLYDILTALQRRMSKASKTPSSVSVLIAANKQDLFTALPADVVKVKLERELSRIRMSRSKGMLESGVGTDDFDDNQDAWLGSYGTEKFTFDQLREFDIDIDIIEGNAVGAIQASGSGVEKWWKWMINQI